MPEVFQMSRLFQIIGLSLVGLTGVLAFVIARATVTGRVERSFAATFFLFAFPFFLAGLYFLVRHTGQVVLTEDALIRRRLGQESRIAYQAITDVQLTDSNIPPNLSFISSEGTVVSFSQEVENFPALYAALSARIPAMQAAERVSFPWTVRLSSSYFWDLALGVVVIFAVVGGIILGNLRRNPAANPVQLTLVMLGVGGFILFLYLGASLGELRDKPLEIVFDKGSITVRPILGEPTVWATEIANIRIEEDQRSVRVLHPWQRLRYTQHPVIITFRNRQELRIEEEQAWAYGLSPEQLHATLRRLYLP